MISGRFGAIQAGKPVPVAPAGWLG